jgi:hypothetical protein
MKISLPLLLRAQAFQLRQLPLQTPQFTTHIRRRPQRLIRWRRQELVVRLLQALTRRFAPPCELLKTHKSIMLIRCEVTLLVPNRALWMRLCVERMLSTCWRPKQKAGSPKVWLKKRSMQLFQVWIQERMLSQFASCFCSCATCASTCI